MNGRLRVYISSSVGYALYVIKSRNQSGTWDRTEIDSSGARARERAKGQADTSEGQTGVF